MNTNVEILVANTPATYRELLASELPRLRPGLRVLPVDPAELDAVVTRLRPRLVICDRLTESVRRFATSWIVLDPKGKAQAVIGSAGAQQLVPDPPLTDLLVAIDAAARAAA